MVTKYTPQHVANYFLWLAKKYDVKDMTILKLMKISYIAYAWYFALTNNKLFDEKIQAWQFGPVIPSLYHEFKHFGKNPIDSYAIDYNITSPEMAFESPEYPMIKSDDDQTLKILGAVWENYKHKNATELVDITHTPEHAWFKAWDGGNGQNATLDDSEIKKSAERAIIKFSEKD